MSHTIEYFRPRVLEEVESWPVGILACYTRLVQLLTEFGPVLGMPHCRRMGSGLFELRPVLHAFIKKTQKISPADLGIARRRVREVRNG